MPKQIFNPLSGQFDTVLSDAAELSYDNATSGLVADDVQAAIDELDGIIDALPDPITYKGTWNATTNTPTLLNSNTGVTGFLYQVTVAGTVNFGAGPISFAVGDKVVNDGTIWDKWDLTDAVTSVNSLTGAVVLGTDNVAEGATNLYFTDERAQDAAGAMATNSTKVSLTYNDGANTLTPNIVAGSLVNADISASAAIAHSKMAALTVNRAMVTNASGAAAAATTTAAEIGFVNGVTSAIQTQLNGKQATITGAATTVTASNLTASRAVVSDGSGKIAVSAVTNTELGHVAGVTSAIQTQLNAKEATITGAATTVTSANLTANRAVVSDGSGKIAASAVTATELGHVAGVTSAIQTQLNDKQSLATITTAGDLYVGTGPATTDRLPAPSDGGTIVPDFLQPLGWRSADYKQTQGKPGKNYIQYADFENFSVFGWSLGTTGALTNGLPTGTPSFGSGAAGTLSIAATATSPIAGTYSLSYVSSAATTVGNMFASQVFTVDSADQAKVLTVRFAYRAQTNPSNANWSGTSANSFSWAIWDVTNSVWVAPAGAFGMTQSSGVGIATGTFQTSSNSTQYRLVVYNSAATTGAVTVYFDDFFVGPQTAPIGSVVTDWVAYTPTLSNFGTVSNVAVYSRRVGSDLEIRGNFQGGASPVGSPVSMTLGFNGINSSVTSASSIPASGTVLGKGNIGFSSTTVFSGFSIIGTASSGVVFFGLESSTTNGYNASNGTSFGVSATLSFFARIPIAGWSSNVQMSNDTDTRVVAFQATSSSSQSIPSATVVQITGFTPNVDTHASWSAGSQHYVAPVSGLYRVKFNAVWSASVGGGAGGMYAIVERNNLNVLNDIFGAGVAGANQVRAATVTGIISVTAGQTIRFSVFQDTGSTLTLVGFGINATIERLSGPSVIAATESVNASYSNVAGTAITTSYTTMPFATRLFDSHNAFVTNTFTAPVSGKYRISANLVTASTTLSTGQVLGMRAVQAGSASVTRLLSLTYGNGGTNQWAVGGSTLFNLAAGDTLVIQALCNVVTSLAVDATANHLSIERVGN